MLSLLRFNTLPLATSYLITMVVVGCCVAFPTWAEVPEIKTDGEDGIISIESFNQLLKDYPEHFYWIDVRDREEVAHDGTHALARVVPMGEFTAEIPKLPTDKPIIFFCNTGARAGEAYDFVNMKRKDVRVYFLDAHVAFDKQPLPRVSPAD